MKKIRKYFKNAKRVACIMNGIYEIDLKTIYKDKDNLYWCRCHDTTDHCLLFENGEFAQIIEEKKKKVVSGNLTAVDWLGKICNDRGYILMSDYFKQAKEMEKQQLKNCWDASDENMRRQFSSSEYKRITFEQWLNQQ